MKKEQSQLNHPSWLLDKKTATKKARLLISTPESYMKLTKRLLYLEWLCKCDYEGLLMQALFDKALIDGTGFEEESNYYQYIKSAAREGGDIGAREEIEKTIELETKELKSCYAYIKNNIESIFGAIEPKENWHPRIKR